VKPNQINPISLRSASQSSNCCAAILALFSSSLDIENTFSRYSSRKASHSDFVVIPALVEKIYATVDSRSDDSNAVCLGDVEPTEMQTHQSLQ
jgi:hypothetical protein